jgi:hypothetical protein
MGYSLFGSLGAFVATQRGVCLEYNRKEINELIEFRHNSIKI